jgi:hypothetical protein
LVILFATTIAAREEYAGEEAHDCHQVTVLNLGRTLAAGTPEVIRVHKEVVSAYLGG